MFSKNKTYELPLSVDYVAKWGLLEAVRELLQNALDSDSPFNYEFSEDCLRITSSNSSLHPRTLLLGVTSKTGENEARGQFGEGYKLALLVLTRLGHDVTVYNEGVKWIPRIASSPTYGEPVMFIDETPNPLWGGGLMFEINGLTATNIAEIKGWCMKMWSKDELKNVVGTVRGRILMDHPGVLYVGGLFVTKTELEFGYDFNPADVELERDRQTVSSFDLCHNTKEIWFATERFDRVAELMEENCPDLEYAQYSCPELVKEACYKLFKEKHPGAIAVSSQEELEQYVGRGMTNVVVVNKTFYSGVRGSDSYISSRVPLTPPPTPEELLREWYKDNKKYLKRYAQETIKSLILESAKWRVK